jgi:hypothetical protein
MEPAALPWYRSPVYVGIVTSIVSQLLAAAGKADLFSTEQINTVVTWGFQGIALGALAVAEYKRRKSKVQPLRLTKATAAEQVSPPGDRP